MINNKLNLALVMVILTITIITIARIDREISTKEHPQLPCTERIFCDNCDVTFLCVNMTEIDEKSILYFRILNQKTTPADCFLNISLSGNVEELKFYPLGIVDGNQKKSYTLKDPFPKGSVNFELIPWCKWE